MGEPILTTGGGVLAETYRTSGVGACVRKILTALKAYLPLWILGRRTNKGVGAYFDLITDDARLFYGDNFHFGYFAKGTETFEEAVDAHTDMVARMARLEDKTHVLDIGCGIGAPAIRIAKKYNCRMTGINISTEQVRQARSLIHDHGLSEKVHVEKGNALELPYPDNSFDAILSLEVAGDICVVEKQKGRLIREMKRVLKPGGHIGFSDLVFKVAPPKDEDRTVRVLLYHEGSELITDWCRLFEEEGLTIQSHLDILSETMPTWDRCLAIYEERREAVDRRYGKKLAHLIRQHLKKIPVILSRYCAYPVLSIQKPRCIPA